MGFTIMESFMDDVEVESMLGIGTKVKMRKKIKKNNDVEVEEEKNMLNATIRGDE